NLLTHTHTHTHTHTQYAHLASNNTFFLLAYARAKRAVTPVNKGLLGVSFVRFFMPFCELDLEQNKNEITTILINEVMRKKQVKKSYSAPECMIIQVNEATYLMDTSFPSQHNPAQPGGTISNAKAINDWEDLESKGGVDSSFSWEE
ncbi:hypothetical protein, partial [Prevotella sp.]